MLQDSSSTTADTSDSEEHSDGPFHLLNPISFPPEIAAQIFSFACHVIPGNIRRQRQPHPLSLGRVCKSWRELAWSTSELWTTVDIRLRNADTSCDDKWTVLYNWINRAKGQDLDIYIEKTGEYCDPPMELMELLVEHSSQWRSVCLRIPLAWCGFLSNRPYDIDAFHLPRLTSFTYDNPLRMMPTPPTVSIFPLDLTGAINLHDITLGDWLTNTTTAVVILPANQITRLSILDYSQTDLRRQFNLFPNLAEAHISEVRPRKKFEAYTFVRHNRLHTLHVSFRTRAPLDLLLSRLTFPSLKCLGVTVNCTSGATSALASIAVSSFISRSQCDLTHLYLGFSIEPGVEEELIDLFATLDSLEVLEIKNLCKFHMEFGDAFFGAFYPANDRATSLVPSLRLFAYEGPLIENHLETLLEAMILRADVDTVTTMLEKLTLRSCLRIITGSVQNFPMLLSEITLKLDYQLRVKLKDLVNRGVFELSSYYGKLWRFDEDRNVVYVLG